MDKHSSWYIKVHLWVRHNNPKPELCSMCGCNDRRLNWANISGKYKWELSDYQPLCSTCHSIFDSNAGVCKIGHTITADNAYYDKNPIKGRICGICKKINNHNNYLKRKAEGYYVK